MTDPDASDGLDAFAHELDDEEFYEHQEREAEALDADSIAIPSGEAFGVPTITQQQP